MAAGGDIQDLCDEAACPICLEYFKDPVTVVGCGHNFCRACLAQCWGGLEEDGGASCPQCRKIVQQRNHIPNRQLANFVEIAKKLSHRGQKRAREVCQKHQEPLKLFCKDHEAPICLVCDRSKEHGNHKVIPQEEAFQEYKDWLCSSLKILMAEREKLLMYKADTEKESQDLLKQLLEERQKTMADFRQIHQFLEEEEKILLAQMEEMEKEIARRRDEHMARLSRELSSLENIIQEMEEKRQQPANEFLQDIRRTLQRYEKKEVFENPVAFPPELTCRIGEFCDRKPRLEGVRKLFQAACPADRGGGGAEPQEEGAANVTLDPATAHPQLVLSADCKSVRWKDKRQALPNNPERFDFHPYVLGREGVTAGKRFWDVDVGSEGKWTVGVARKSVRRKGFFCMSPEEGIWAVRKWGDGYHVNVLGYTTLSLRQELKRIRVTLNYAEGQVAFSEADTGVHLYTYSGASFRGEIILSFFGVDGNGHLTLSP